jgi:hypothetical protein
VFAVVTLGFSRTLASVAHQKAFIALKFTHAFLAVSMNIERVILTREENNILMRDTVAMIRTAATQLQHK